jgi:archaemetzincin
MVDLYPASSWNFVFGQATLSDRVGIYSLARFDPPAVFAGEGELHGRGLERACKVLTHEAGHMFGIRHCIAWACVMNGSNHLGELDRQPSHLCPVDLRKLQHATEFDVAKRYARLAVVSEELGFLDAATWNRERAASLDGEGRAIGR